MADKITVQRGNVVLTVDAATERFYLDKGYNVIDANGNVTKRAVPTDIGALQKAYIENEKTIKQLEAKVKKLESELKAAKTTEEKTVEEKPAKTSSGRKANKK